MTTLLSAGALATGLALAVTDMIREARRERPRAPGHHPAAGGADT